MGTEEQKRIGNLVKNLRQKRGITQSELAEQLSTSQSAIARIESGGQNVSTAELIKLSTALQHPIITLSRDDVDDIRVVGGKKLSGEITTNTSKNGAMVLVCAALLNKGTTVIHNLPQIEEIKRLIEIIVSIGVTAKWVGPRSLSIQPPVEFDIESLNIDAAQKIRSSILLIGPLAHYLKDFQLPHSGGCKMGNRTIAAHRYVLQELGVQIKTKEHFYEISHNGLTPAELTMYEASDTGTENALMAASRIPGKTTIHFAQQNYMVQDLIGYLRALGVQIRHNGIASLEITGVQEIHQDIEYYNSEDPIESMAFLSAGIVTGSTLTVRRCPIDFLRLELYKLQLMGQEIEMSEPYTSHNGFSNLADVTVRPSKLKALPDKLHPLPYPGINVDNLPFFVPISTLASGSTLVHDWMWENRAIYFTELNRMGADIKLADPHRVIINGPTEFRPAQIVCPPALRPSMIILIAMLAAPGQSILRSVYSIKRGYEDIASRLNSIGAEVEYITEI